MEWDRETCFSLIDEYENCPELWNPKHGLYYHKSRKHECWTSIAEALGCSTVEVKKKMESLLGSFRREKAKERKTIGGNGQDPQDVYVSKWFAFHRMAFLMDRDQPRPPARMTLDADGEYESIQQDAAAVDDDEEDFPNQISSSPQPAEHSHHSHHVFSSAALNLNPVNITSFSPSSCSSSRMMPRPKRQRPGSEDDVRMDDALDILKDVVNKNTILQDECGIFGQHVANKLRSYDFRTRAMVQHEINTALFNADMKLFPPPSMPLPMSTISFSSSSCSNSSTHKCI